MRFMMEIDDQTIILQASQLRIVDQLDNLYLLEDPMVDEEPEDVVVVRNKPAILHCEASLSGPGSSRSVKIKWKRDGEFLNFPDFNDRR